MREGSYDFAYVNPYHYTLFNKKTGYLAFAQEREGEIVAFPAASALAATWLPMQYLSEHGASVTPQDRR